MKLNIFKNLDAYYVYRQNQPEMDVSDTVREIIATVRKEKDKAVQRYTEKFDEVRVSQFRVPIEAMRTAKGRLSEEHRQVFKEAISNIQHFHQRQKTETQLNFHEDGTVLGWKVTPIDAVGIYAPAGEAPLFSSLMMSAVPAQIAGVPRIAIASAPEKNGLPHPTIMATAALLGIDELYAIGGVQAIAALAYGTESVKRVHKITGPGNSYVTEAKRQVYGVVGIESIAGPSDILILCDQPNQSIDYITRDMLSQMEHGGGAHAILITTSTDQARAVQRRLLELIPTLPRREILEESLKHTAIIVVSDLDEAFEAVNEIAPEHLEILTDQPFEDLYKVRNAGAIFLGSNTPEPVGDYFAGPSHILPTEGSAKFSSPLGVQDFTKTSSVLHYSETRLKQDGRSVMELAKLEGLYAHAAAIEARLK